MAQKDLRVEWRTWETLSSTFVFALTVLVVFQFAFGLGTVRAVGVGKIVPGVIWTVVAFAAVVGMVRSFQLERPRDTLGALFLAPVDRGAIYAGKALANWIKLLLLQLALWPLTALLFGYSLTDVAAALLFVSLVHGFGLTALGTLFAGITTRLGRGEALLAVLLFPAASPLLIAAARCTSAVLDGGSLASVSHWLLIAVGLDALYLMLALLTFEFVLEE